MSSVVGIGIGVPGDVDMATGVTGDLPNLPGRWRNVPVGPTIADALALPVGIINDAKAFALAESGSVPPPAPPPPSVSPSVLESAAQSSPMVESSMGWARWPARSGT